ncbi:MAG TPA: glycosyltransferase family 4 protein [Pyrinomonadaceae bacterium]|nr:glycosyltransferase family 4 protein [Pyrinomonadaceae bacterium]
MKRVAIVTPSITSGDAVGNDVVGMYRVLQRQGFDARIFAESWTLTFPRISPPEAIRSFLKKPSDVLIYHYSRGWDPGLDLLRDLKSQTVVRYHNVTPPQFFTEYSADLAAMCFAGRQQLTPIANADCDRYLSASAYNMKELLAEGASEAKSFVVPPFHHIDRLFSLQAEREVLDAYRDNKTNICMVGRVSPNKSHPALIEAFAAYHHDYNRDSRLLIIGKEETRLKTYSPLLREMANRLKIREAVVFAGGVSEAALKAYYQCAHVFMITSEHEGFCVPLVEAMALGVPIVGYASSAIGETVAEAGIIWEKRNPYLLAETIDRLVRKSLSADLSARGRRRFEEHFTNEKIEEKFLTAMSGIL